MRFAYRPVAVAILVAAGLMPAIAVLPGPVAAAAARSAAPPGGTRLWAARFSAGTGRTATATSVAASPDGATVYVTGITSLPQPTPMNTFDTVAYNAATGAVRWVARFHGINGRHVAGSPTVGVSPDGSKIFVFGHFLNRGGGFRGETMMVAYDGATGRQMWSAFGVCTTPAQAVAVSPDSSTVYATGSTFNGYCTAAYNAATGAVRWHASYQTGQFIHPTADSLALSPDGADLFVTGTAGTVAYAASTGAQLWSDHYKQRWGRDDEHVVVSPDGSAVFVAGATKLPAGQPEHFLTVAYNAATGAQIWAEQKSPSTFDSFASSVAVSPDGSSVFVTGPSLTSNATPSEYLTIDYNAATGAALWVRHLADPGGNFGTLPSLAVSPGGSAVIVAGSADQSNGELGYAMTSYAVATGARLWTAHYQSPGGAASRAAAVTATASEVFVTGTSARNSTQTDYATVALQG
jgi:PQQ-like domain